MAFHLSTSFTVADLERFDRGKTKIVIAKPSNDGGDPNVAWIAYNPLQQNMVNWEEEYGIYASNTSVESGGAVLLQLSATDFPANIGKTYLFGQSGSFGPPQDDGQENAYRAVNAYNNLPKGFMTFGLYQNALVDGSSYEKNAVSAAPVLYKSRVTMTPYTTVYLWTQSEAKSNSVVTDVMSTMTRVTFGGSTSRVSLQYDPKTGGFTRMGSTLRLDSNTGRLTAVGGEESADGVKLDYILPVLV